LVKFSGQEEIHRAVQVWESSREGGGAEVEEMKGRRNWSII
jgi:hypothetical protein